MWNSRTFLTTQPLGSGWNWEDPCKFSGPALCLTNEDTEAGTKGKVAKLDITLTMFPELYLLNPLHLLR